jgi:hypothetical protein
MGEEASADDEVTRAVQLEQEGLSRLQSLEASLSAWL